MKWRITATACVVFVTFFLLGSKVTYLQVYKSHDLKTIFNKQFIHTEEISPPRGTIFDRHGALLAMNMFMDSYFCMPKEVEDTQQVTRTITRWFSLQPHDVETIFKKRKHFFWIKRKVAPDEIHRGEQEFLPKGVGCIKESKRLYPRGSLACHILGATGLDNHGLSGIEYSLNKYLTGEIRTVSSGKDALGRRIVSDDTLLNTDVIRGSDVYLTIDERIQYFAERCADALCQQRSPYAMTIIVQQVKTGEILAMVNRPQFDGNNVQRRDVSAMKNDAVAKIYEPGSTMKVLVGAAALQEKVVTLDTKIFCENGKYALADHVIKDHEPRGTLSFKDVIVYSSNIGMAKVGQKMGRDRLYKYFLSFGFGNYSGICLPGDAKGIVRHPKLWSGLSTSISAFGQEIGVTPIQLITAYSCIANHGILLEPQIIRTIKDAQGKDVSSFRIRKVRRVISDAVCAQMIDAMEDVVERGTAENVQLPGYRIAGKTGTAQKMDTATRRYSETGYISSFCGFFPVSDPQITILVIVDEPQGVYWGGEVCGPVFKTLAKEIVTYLHIPPDKEATLTR